MAIYSMSMKKFSRSKGHSAVAASAYRSGQELEDMRTGESHDYTKKGGVHESFIIAPSNAPEWANDREQLWNKAEEAETRKNSTVAREVRIALPSELNEEQRREAAEDYAQRITDRYQVACDVSIHEPDKGGDNRNHHAHIMFTTRRLEENGFTEKTREIDDRKQGPEEVNYLREEWAKAANQHLEKAGYGERIDHRSYEAQGSDKEATLHMGKEATHLERKGVETEIGNYNREVQARNQERESLKQENLDLFAQLKNINNELEQLKNQQHEGQQSDDPFAKFKQSEQQETESEISTETENDPFAKFKQKGTEMEKSIDHEKDELENEDPFSKYRQQGKKEEEEEEKEKDIKEQEKEEEQPTPQQEEEDPFAKYQQQQQEQPQPGQDRGYDYER